MPLQNKPSVKQIEHTKCPADKNNLRLNDGGGLVVVFYRSGRSVYRLRVNYHLLKKVALCEPPKRGA
ncbi:hypothetical protein D5E80_01195 [Vibrio parahaemolyticus]|nr:hypothetical protein D5E80_01195 [Vibrio parahaemolyticus]